MKKRYLDLMEQALSAYSDAHISHYFDEGKKNRLTEHGLPRLTATDITTPLLPRARTHFA